MRRNSFGWVRFLVFCFLYKINLNPRKNICCGKKWPKCPKPCFSWVGLALGWGVRRFHINNNIHVGSRFSTQPVAWILSRVGTLFAEVMDIRILLNKYCKTESKYKWPYLMEMISQLPCLINFLTKRNHGAD